MGIHEPPNTVPTSDTSYKYPVVQGLLVLGEFRNRTAGRVIKVGVELGQRIEQQRASLLEPE